VFLHHAGFFLEPVHPGFVPVDREKLDGPRGLVFNDDQALVLVFEVQIEVQLIDVLRGPVGILEIMDAVDAFKGVGVHALDLSQDAARGLSVAQPAINVTRNVEFRIVEVLLLVADIVARIFQGSDDRLFLQVAFLEDLEEIHRRRSPHVPRGPGIDQIPKAFVAQFGSTVALDWTNLPF